MTINCAGSSVYVHILRQKISSLFFDKKISFRKHDALALMRHNHGAPNGAHQHIFLQRPPFTYQISSVIPARHPPDVLLDDQPSIQVHGGVVRRGSRELDPALVPPCGRVSRL